MIGAESFCFGNCTPVKQYWEAQETGPGADRYVNGGFVCGKTPALAIIYDWIIANNMKDDQMGFAAFMNKNSFANIKMDTDKLLVFNDTNTDVPRNKPEYLLD